MEELRTSIRIAVDAVVFTVNGDELQLLLIKRKYEPYRGKYALPGGHVKDDEDLHTAVKRELEEETNVKGVFLKKLTAYGAVDRDPRFRVVSIAFLALISGDHDLRASTDASEAQWFSMKNLPDLGFDHHEIVVDALKQLQYELQTTNIAVQILPKKFTLRQLQKLYENVLDKALDKRNFRKKMKELEILTAHNETVRDGAHRPAQLFSFKSKKYESIRDKMNVFLR